MVGDVAGDRANDVERVERWHARPAAGDVDSRVGNPQALGCRANRQAQEQTLRLGAVFLHWQPGCQRRAHLLVEEHRVFARLLRKHPFGESGNKDDPERSAARLMRAADEDRAVSVRRRVILDRTESIREDVADFLERHRADGAHGPQLCEDAQHARGFSENTAARAPRTA